MAQSGMRLAWCQRTHWSRGESTMEDEAVCQRLTQS